MNRVLLTSMLLALGSLACESEGPVRSSFSISLDELIGPIPFATGSSQRVDFDFGQPFTSIDGVSLEVQAEVTAQQFDVCGFVFDPQPCVREVHLLGFFGLIDKEGSSIPGVIISERIDVGDDRFALSAEGGGRAAFRGGESTGWDFLLDGSGTLEVAWNEVLGNPDRLIENPVEPAGVITDARLIIEGVRAADPR